MALQEKLTNNYEDIKTVLIHLGFEEDKIRYQPHKNLILSTRPEADADNPNGFLMYTDRLNYMYTTRSGNGNIFTLVMELKKVNFPQSLKLICEWLNIKDAGYKISYPFGGFYRNIYKTGQNAEVYLNEYEKTALPPPNALSQRFFKDGISFIVQEKWGIRYDFEGDNILIPIHDQIGRLVGCKARNNQVDCPHERRWFAYLPYSKTHVVYGYAENYRAIQKKNTVIVFEAEKSVLQCASFNCNVAVAIGGHNISQTQVKYITGLMTNKIIVAFDSDICEEEVIYEAKKLKTSVIMNNQVGYIYDKNHEYLGDKDAPSDHGKKIFKQLINNCVIWL